MGYDGLVRPMVEAQGGPGSRAHDRPSNAALATVGPCPWHIGNIGIIGIYTIYLWNFVFAVLGSGMGPNGFVS